MATDRIVDLQVDGMSCAACVRRVERALLKVPGVTAAEVNLQSERARIHGAAGLAPLLAAIGAAGYHARSPAQPAPPSHDGLFAALALALAAPLLAPMLGLPWMLPPAWQLAIAAIVQAAFGARFYRSAWSALRNGAGSMDTLVVLGTSAAFGLSLWDFWAGGPLYFEASAAIIALVRTGKWLEGRARRQAGGALRALEKLRPDQARLVQDGTERMVAVTTLKPGSLVHVLPGERFPADGTVHAGEGEADESLLTGESMPVPKQAGSPVIGGAMNGDTALLVSVTGHGTEGRLAQMVRLMESAEAAKPDIQRLADRVSAVFVPAVIGVAVLTFAGWWLAGAGAGQAVVVAVSVLVIACPCALGLATPAAIAAGIGVAARYGILLRDPGVLEQAGTIRTIVFDKTGTLTEGHPDVVRVEGDILAQAAALQAGSNHPLALATRRAADGLVIPVASNVRTLPGRGVTGTVGGRTLLLGNARLLADHGLTVAARVETTSFLATADGTLLGALVFADRLRDHAADVVAALQARGLQVEMLTGDAPGPAQAVAAQAGITTIHPAALPDDKAAHIAALREAGPVAMIGDGVNDAAALAAATLGIAMAGSTDVAGAAAGITLMRPDLTLVPAALDIAARIQRRIKWGLAWAFAYNLLGLPLAAAGLLSPAIAGAAMAFSSAAVVGNALLLRHWMPPAL